MGLGCQVIDLIRLHLADDMNQTRGVGQIAMMEYKISVSYVRILIKMVDSIRIEKRSPSLNAMNLISFFQ